MGQRPLEGRHALVTGAGRGLGRASALALADAGAAVTLMSRSEDELAEVAEGIERAGGTAIVRACDVIREERVESALAAMPAHDILVNSAGSNQPEPFVDVEATTFDQIFSLNVRAAFMVTQLVVRRLIAAERPGVVINISSQMGHVGAANRSVYCATKHALEGLTKALGVELAPHGIRVVSVAPTFVDTPMTRPFFQQPAFRDEVLDSIPLGRLGTPQEVAAAVVFLAGPNAAMITGSSLLVDGGWTAK